jgi:hypothetical protein
MNLKLTWLARFSEKNNLDIIRLLLFFFILLTFSLNLFYKLSLNGAYVQGLLVDYLIPKIYLTEFFLIPFLLLNLKQLGKIKLPTIFCFLSLLFLIRQLLSGSALAAFTQLIHLTEVLLFFRVIKNNALFKSKLGQKFTFAALLSTVAFQSLLAIYQFIFQKSLLAYQFFGETNLHDLANISRAQFSFGEKILPYGSTAHPNILAGIVTVLSILLLQKSQNNKWLQLVLLANALLIIFISQSLSALLTLGLFGFYLFLERIKNKKILLALAYYFFLLFLPYLLSKMISTPMSSDSIQRRVNLNQAALEMFKENTFLGVGINNFTLAVEKYSGEISNREIVRFVQPVHNLLFLMLAEGGLLLLTLVWLLIREFKIDKFYQKTLVLLALASLDHYLLSQFSGMSLLAIFYFLIV